MSSCETDVSDDSGKKLSEEDVKECVVQLRELLNADKKFENFRKDDAHLLRYLHCTEFNFQEAFKRAEEYYDLILNNPDWFATKSPIEFKSVIDQNTRLLLPDARDKDGRRILVSKVGTIDTSKMSAMESAQLDDYWLELVMDEPETQSAGISIIVDMNGYSWSMFRWFTPSIMKTGTKKAELYPCKEIVHHVVNTSMLMNTTLNLVWPFLSAKIKERIKFHFEDWESLHKYIAPDVLPPEYGGTGPEINFKNINQWLYDNNSRIADNLKHQQLTKS